MLALCLLFPKVRRPWWIPAATGASLGIETVQMLALPGRRFDWWDVVGNTSGAVIAVVLVMLVSGLTTAVRGTSGATHRPPREPRRTAREAA